MKQPIEPKPTQYGNTLFRSRLEARWAVFLDFTNNVLNWEYEPQTFTLQNGWEYTPDFKVSYFPQRRLRQKQQPKPQQIYLEIKPKETSNQYDKFLARFSVEHNLNILICICPMFRQSDEMLTGIITRQKPRVTPKLIDDLFPNWRRGHYHARTFRFDLKY